MASEAAQEIVIDRPYEGGAKLTIQNGIITAYSELTEAETAWGWLTGLFGGGQPAEGTTFGALGYADYDENNKEYSLGFSLHRKGWTLGASYRKTDTNSKDTPINKYNLYDGYRDAKAYNIGLSYEIGPFTTGVSYFNSKSNNILDRLTILSRMLCYTRLSIRT